MNTFGHDPELPAGYQDADFITASLEREAKRIADMRKRGICDHGWIKQGPDSFLCYHCDKTFPGQRFEF